jgi:hypothetical protein
MTRLTGRSAPVPRPASQPQDKRIFGREDVERSITICRCPVSTPGLTAGWPPYLELRAQPGPGRDRSPRPDGSRRARRAPMYAGSTRDPAEPGQSKRFGRRDVPSPGRWVVLPARAREPDGGRHGGAVEEVTCVSRSTASNSN